MRRATYTPHAKSVPSKIRKFDTFSPNSIKLSFYNQPVDPNTELDLADFEKFALDRIAVLDFLDANSHVPLKDLQFQMRRLLNERIPLSKTTSNDDAKREMFKDHISHLILRIPFCQNAETRKRFVKLETTLFRIRLENELPEHILQFARSVGCNWPVLTADEVAKLPPFPFIQMEDLNKSFVFKLPMEKAMDLAARRLVVLQKGFALIPSKYVGSLLVNEFSTQLEHALSELSRKKTQFVFDERLEPVLQLAINTLYRPAANKTINQNTTNFKMEHLDTLDAENHLPLSASLLYRNLKIKRHANNDERLQLQRFLKHIGMPCDEVIKLYKTYYSDYNSKSDIEYGIKHTYGLVGGRKNYPPHTLEQICRMNPQPGSVSGCPFKTLSGEQLAKLLKIHGAKDTDAIDAIVKLSAEYKYNFALTKTYELLHPHDKTVYTSTILSPNEYFDRSWAARLANASDQDTKDASQGTQSSQQGTQ